jgi:hypothetical protein
MFFNLPSNILAEIYTFDSTYHDKKKESDYEIWKKSFFLFFRVFLRHFFFQKRPILKGKLEVFFDYLLNHYVKSEKYSDWFTFANEPNGENSVGKHPYSSDVTIIAFWKGNMLRYDNYELFVNLNNDYDDFDDISSKPLVVRITAPCHYHFQGFIYSKKEYDELNRLECEVNPIAYNTIYSYGSRESNPFELFRYGDENFIVVQFLLA